MTTQGKLEINAKNIEQAPHRLAPLGSFILSLVVAALFLGQPARAQTPVTIPDSSAPIAFTANNTGSASTYVLNADSSLSVLQNNGITINECPAFLSDTSLLQGAVYFDASSSRLYIAIAGNPARVTYDTINADGTCSAGPAPVSLANSFGIPVFGYVELAADSAQGNVYVLVYTSGTFSDSLYVLSAANFTASPVPQAALDYSASYGPLVVDPSNHLVYINDFGDAINEPPGFNPSPGFFVYDPNYSSTPANNIAHVAGYVNSAAASVPINAQTLLVDGKGKLFIVNQNTSPATALTYIANPFTILDTTQFSFFANTQSSGASVYVEPPAAAITVVPSGYDYFATSAADIDTTHGIVYAFAYLATAASGKIVPYPVGAALFSYSFPGNLLTPLTESLTLPNLYPSTTTGPWSALTFDPKSNTLMLFTPSGALGVSSPLSCSALAVQEVLGGGAASYTLSEPAVNFTSGYIYDAQTVYPNTTLYSVAPNSCSTSTLTLSPDSLANGTAGELYGPVPFSASPSPAGLTFAAQGLPAGLSMSPAGSLSGTPEKTGPFEVTVTASDSSGDTGMETLPLTIGCPAISVGPAQLPGGVTGVPYDVAFTQSGGVGSVTFAAFGPFPAGISPNSSGLSGTPTAIGTFQIGVQATDSNGCQSPTTTILTLTISAPKFSMSPANGDECGPIFPFPASIPPIANINGINYFEVQVYLYSSGNVAASANMTSATLGGFQAVNSSAPGASIFPVIFNNPGTLLQPGACVHFTLEYPTNNYGNPIPDGHTAALSLQGTYSMTTNQTYQGTWSVLDRGIELSMPVNVSGGGGVTEDK
jgi:hypothetical protein